VHLAFDIFQGLGIAIAVGIRPFLPALTVGALAAGHVEIHFNGTDFSFLQSAPFLIGIGVAAALLLVVHWRLGESVRTGRTVSALIAACALALGALLFAGALARDHHPAWAGAIGGVVVAALAVVATTPLLARVSSRLGAEDALATALYVEGTAVAVAALSVVAPPVGVIAVLLLAWLLLAGRRRESQKYAGLRILR
jgi:hypothetical protein